MKKPENDNIGLGLASSKAIATEMGGNMKLKLSNKGLTVFKFKIPVQVNKKNNQSKRRISHYINEQSNELK